MALIDCQECEKQYSDTVLSCPHCGFVRPKPTKPKALGTAVSSTGVLSVLALCLVGLYFLVSNPSGTSIQQDSASTSAPTKNEITYQVYGTAGNVMVTYINAQGGMEQVTTYTPFKKSFYVEQDQVLSISAQNQNATGTVEVSILLNGVMVRESQSSGPYTIASTSGKCC